MAAWCFVCDGPVTGESCPRCGRAPVVVEDERSELEASRVSLEQWFGELPGWLWPVLAILLAALLFPLFHAVFFLD